MNKNLFLRHGILFGIVLLVFPVGITSYVNYRIKHIIAAFTSKTPLNGTILIANDKKIIYLTSFGYADIPHTIPNTPTTRYLIGSLTKQFTAAAILKLVEAHKINLFEHISTYLNAYDPLWAGEMPEWASKITVHQLLTHSAGLPEYVLLPHFEEFYAQPHSTAELIRFFAYHDLLFEPGTRYQYSGSGYQVLGAIIEKVSGHSYNEFLQKEFCIPLFLHHTYSPHHQLLSEVLRSDASLSTGYTISASHEWLPADEANMSTAFAEASIISTVTDLWKWQNALYNGSLLSPESKDSMLTSYFTDDQETGVGYGVFIEKENNYTIYTHTGRFNGYTSIMLYEPYNKLSIIILSNTTENIFKLGWDILRSSITLLQIKLLIIGVIMLLFVLNIWYSAYRSKN